MLSLLEKIKIMNQVCSMCESTAFKKTYDRLIIEREQLFLSKIQGSYTMSLFENELKINQAVSDSIVISEQYESELINTDYSDMYFNVECAEIDQNDKCLTVCN